MYDIAKDVLEVNDYMKKVTLLNKHSSDLKISADLPQRFEVLYMTTILRTVKSLHSIGQYILLVY